MPPRFDVKTKLNIRTERVKCVDLHPTEPWIIASLYTGHVIIWNYKTSQLVKTFEIIEQPVRCVKFIPRKQWFICGADDLNIRVYDYNTMEKVTQFEAHSDYIRSIAVHPSQPYVISCGDDVVIKMWDWEQNWRNVQTFEGHGHYVMQVVFNPKDPNTFASASLDRTVKVWSLNSSVANFTLEGHDRGVNCVDYFQGGDKPYLVSGADDKLAKIWDYQSRTCVQTLEGHMNNVTACSFHPLMPIVLTGSEDGSIRMWNANTYRLESTLSYNHERVWTIACLRGSNKIAVGFDDGLMCLKSGRTHPAMSMDSTSHLVWTRGADVFTANVKGADASSGERLALQSKELGSCDIHPQTLRHSPNGRFVAAIGDGEYVVYTALAWRNMSFGQGEDLVWASDSSRYAVRDQTRRIKIFQNWAEKSQLQIPFAVEAIFGGPLLGVRGSNCLAFYDWDTLNIVRRIDDVVPRRVLWGDSGELVSLMCDGVMYILRFNKNFEAPLDDTGYEDSFAEEATISDNVRSGVWVGECFLYTTTSDLLRYAVGGHAFTAQHMDRPMLLMGYSAKDGRAILADKEVNVVGVMLQHELLAYMTAIVRGDEQTAAVLLPAVPAEHRNRIARFLEAQNLKEQALAVAIDPDMRFDLAIQLGELDIAKQIAHDSDADNKWRVLGDLALKAADIPLAVSCFERSRDYSGLLLLYSAIGDAEGLAKLAEDARTAGRANIAFSCYFSLRQVDKCIDLLVDTGRIPEAAFMARTYKPSAVSSLVTKWKESLNKINPRAAEAIADPTLYENLFPDMKLALAVEAELNQLARPMSADEYSDRKDEAKINRIEDMRTRGGVPEEDGFEDAQQEVVEAEVEKPVAAQSPAPPAQDSPKPETPKPETPKPQSPKPQSPVVTRTQEPVEEEVAEEEEEAPQTPVAAPIKPVTTPAPKGIPTPTPKVGTPVPSSPAARRTPVVQPQEEKEPGWDEDDEDV